jgi:hypothetical protein
MRERQPTVRPGWQYLVMFFSAVTVCVFFVGYGAFSAFQESNTIGGRIFGLVLLALGLYGSVFFARVASFIFRRRR